MGGRGKSSPGNRNITDEQKKALEKYKLTDFYEINRIARGLPFENFQPDLDELEDYKHTTKILDHLIDQSPLKQRIITYRGINGSMAQSLIDQFKTGKLKTGDEIIDKGFMSVSTDSNIGQKFSKGQVLVTINLPKGTKGINAEIIKTGWKEQEIILGRGTKLKINDVKLVNNQLHIQTEVL
jgi:hypothetical protein